MVVTSLGGLGMGFVWGWLLVLLTASPKSLKRPFVAIAAFILATLLLAVQIHLLANLTALVIFLTAAAFSLIIHIAWRSTLAEKS